MEINKLRLASCVGKDLKQILSVFMLFRPVQLIHTQYYTGFMR